MNKKRIVSENELRDFLLTGGLVLHNSIESDKLKEAVDFLLHDEDLSNRYIKSKKLQIRPESEVAEMKAKLTKEFPSLTGGDITDVLVLYSRVLGI